MLLEYKDITFKYPNTDTYVFKDLSCRVCGPGFHALFGPSGVGKTTLAKMMAREMVNCHTSLPVDTLSSCETNWSKKPCTLFMIPLL